MLFITKAPETYPINNGNVRSRWLSAFNECIFEITRKDCVVTGIINNGSNITVTVLGSLTPGTTLNSIYLGVAGYEDVYTVLSHTGNNIVLDTQYNGNGTGFLNFNSFYTNYFIEISVYQGNTLIDVSRHRPFTDGLIKFDVSAALTSRVKFKNKYAYSAINERDIDLSGEFSFIAIESYLGQTQGDYQLQGDTQFYYYDGSARQIQSRWGSNLADFCPMIPIISIPDGRFSAPSLNTFWYITVNSNTHFNHPAQSAEYSSTNNSGVATMQHNTITLIPGHIYEVIIKIDYVFGADVAISLGGTDGQTFNTVGTFKDTITCGAGTDFTIKFASTGMAAHTARVKEVVLIDGDGLPETNKARFLVQDGLTPTYFYGFPFDLSFIYSDNISPFQIVRYREYFDQAGVTLGFTTQNNLLINQQKYVNRLRCVDNFPNLGEKTMQVWLELGDMSGLLEDYVQDGAVVDDYVDQEIPIGG